MAAQDLSPEYLNRDIPLTYSKISYDVWMQLFAAFPIVLFAVIVQALSTNAPWQGGGSMPALVDALIIQAHAWGPYILEESSWWFAAAIAALAFMLPSALSALREDSPISGVSLRGFYARLSRLVGGVSVAAWVYALIGADYSSPHTGIRLLLLSAATVVIVMVAALISSHEGYDALKSLEGALKQAQRNLALRNPALSGRPEGSSAKPPVLRAVGLGIVELIILPVVIIIVAYAFVHVGGLPLTGGQTAAIVSLWVCFSVSTAWSSGISVSSEFSRLIRWAAAAFVPLILGALAAMTMTVKFLHDATWHPAYIWVIFATGTLVFAALPVLYATWLSRKTLTGFWRFTFPGAILETLAVFAQRRVSDLSERIAGERDRRRAIAKANGQAHLLLPSD